MIVVKIELWSAITGAKTELARMEICNTGGNPNPCQGDYVAKVLIGRSTQQLDQGRKLRETNVNNWARMDKHVWNLVATALSRMGYGS